MPIFVDKFMKTSQGKCILSIMIGFGIATFFRVVCTGKTCIIFRAAPLDKIDGKIYMFNDKCYSFTPTATNCQITGANKPITF
jgi:hypothetical protein